MLGMYLLKQTSTHNWSNPNAAAKPALMMNTKPSLLILPQLALGVFTRWAHSSSPFGLRCG